MKLYKVCNNYHNLVVEVEIISTDGESFVYIMDLGHKKIEMTRLLIPEKHSPNGSTYFISKNDAYEFRRNKIIKSIEAFERKIEKCREALMQCDS